MKVVVIGTTGFVGSAIVKEALDRGHKVTAIVRHPEHLQLHAKLRPTKGDVCNEGEVARLVAGHETVISAFDPGWENQDIYNRQVKRAGSIIDSGKRRESSHCCSWEEQAAWR